MKLNLIQHSDFLFKSILIILAVVFLFLYYGSRDNNRYQFHWGTDEELPLIFDSRTGTAYQLQPKKDGPIGFWMKFSPFSEVEDIPVKPRKSN